MSEHIIFEAIELLRTARQQESILAFALVDAKSDVEKSKTVILGAAYANGKIDGKDVATRRVQEEGVLLNATMTVMSEERLRGAELKHAEAKIELEYRRERYAAFLVLVRETPA